MKRSHLALLITTAIALPVLASENFSKVESTEQVTTSDNASTSNDTEKVKINGFDINLSKKDKVLAKAFMLTNKEYAQYKYIMKYTPRGVWTPKIDPVTALGNEATTEQERTHYATLLFKIKKQRETKELAFAREAMTVERELEPSTKNWSTRTKSKFGFAKSLPGDKNSLTSLFVNAHECERSKLCSKAVSDLVKSNSKYNKLDIYFVDSSNSDISEFSYKDGIKSDKVASGSITLNHESGEIDKNGLTKYKVPFWVNQNNTGTNVHEIQ